MLDAVVFRRDRVGTTGEPAFSSLARAIPRLSHTRGTGVAWQRHNTYTRATRRVAVLCISWPTTRRRLRCDAHAAIRHRHRRQCTASTGLSEGAGVVPTGHRGSKKTENSSGKISAPCQNSGPTCTLNRKRMPRHGRRLLASRYMSRRLDMLQLYLRSQNRARLSNCMTSSTRFVQLTVWTDVRTTGIFRAHQLRRGTRHPRRRNPCDNPRMLLLHLKMSFGFRHRIRCERMMKAAMGAGTAWPFPSYGNLVN